VSHSVGESWTLVGESRPGGNRGARRSRLGGERGHSGPREQSGAPTDSGASTNRGTFEGGKTQRLLCPRVKCLLNLPDAGSVNWWSGRRRSRGATSGRGAFSGTQPLGPTPRTTVWLLDGAQRRTGRSFEACQRQDSGSTCLEMAQPSGGGRSGRQAEGTASSMDGTLG
jgi:hypothetical protein